MIRGSTIANQVLASTGSAAAHSQASNAIAHRDIKESVAKLLLIIAERILA